MFDPEIGGERLRINSPRIGRKTDALTPQKLEKALTPSFWVVVFSQLNWDSFFEQDGKIISSGEGLDHVGSTGMWFSRSLETQNTVHCHHQQQKSLLLPPVFPRISWKLLDKFG